MRNCWDKTGYMPTCMQAKRSGTRIKTVDEIFCFMSAVVKICHMTRLTKYI